MKKLKILEINNYIYILEDEKGNKISLNIEFINLEQKVSINDVIYISDELIKENNFYTFGQIDNKYINQNELEISKDIIVLEKDNKIIYLQRYYG